jgi:uncharacterized protein (DUF2126 family)
VSGDAVLDAARAHDAALRARGVTVWLGAEPTFTDRSSAAPWWLGDAEGGDKEDRAVALLRAFVDRRAPGARVARAAGRQYPGEERPRFRHGASWERAGGEALLTVTPDPGVVEVNLAPAEDLVTFLADARATWDAAAAAGLAPVRYRWNGDVSDSGGGGQVTLGGPSPERSPFVVHPQLLPRLVRFAQRHPSLSYAFAPECAGSAGQGPRADEGVRERFDELGVALDRLALHSARLGPEELWATLAPLLVDPSGNSHRAELNVEKLWNPWLGARGKLGLVEFRALRMPATPERMVAIASLLRAVAARCALAPYEEPLVDWGAALHDRCALPHFLEHDLAAVLDELETFGLGLPQPLRALVTAPPEPVAEVELDGARLALVPALEFWPLVGDVASQEWRGARIVDSSAARLEVRVEATAPGRVAAQGWEVPLRDAGAGRHVAAVRWRRFLPSPGLHPGLAPQDPLVLHWSRRDTAVSIALHGWIPSGGAYDGLPRDAAEAARRRRERVVVAAARPLAAPADAGRATEPAFTLDVRRLPPLAAFARHAAPPDAV